MQKPKTIAILLATSLLIITAIGIAVAQSVSAQNQTNPYINQQLPPPQGYPATCPNPTVPCYNGSTYLCPNQPYQGCYTTCNTYGPAAQGCNNAYQQGWGMGYGMRGGMHGWNR